MDTSVPSASASSSANSTASVASRAVVISTAAQLLLCDADIIQVLFAVAPVFTHFDEKFEIAFVAQQRFDILARFDPDLSQFGGFFADHNGFLRRLFHINSAINSGQVRI